MLARRRPSTCTPTSSPASSGRPGSGKTTLLRTLLGPSPPTRGTVTRSDGPRIAYVPQLETVNWNFPVTVFECVLMSRTPAAAAVAVASRRSAMSHAVLDRLGIAALANRHIRQLSGGQQQRMFLARALLRHRSCCCSTSRRPASTSTPGTTCCTCSADLTTTASRSC